MELIVFPVANLGAMARPYTLADMLTFAGAAGSGHYPIAGNHFWHGGLHLKSPGNCAVQAVARGKIVAYRINDDWQNYEPIPGSGNQEKFTSSFVLIEHDLEHDYVSGERLFQNCKFYSLYMNLLPLAQVSTKSKLPWFMSCIRTEHVTPIGKRGQAVQIAQQANGMGKISLGGADYWLPLKFFARKVPAGSSSDHYLTDPIHYSCTDPTSIPGAIQKNAVVTCSISVDAGDIIGYPGGVQSATANAFVDDLFHFEVFFNDADTRFFDNLDSYQYAKNQSISGVGTTTAGKMAGGKFWLDAAPQTTPPAAPNPPIWREHYNINIDSYRPPPTPASPSPSPYDAHYPYVPPMGATIAVSARPTLPIKTDLDWKAGKNPWVFHQGRDFFDTNGHVDHTKSLPALNTISRMVVKQRTEWSNTDLPGRFAALQSGEAGLPQLAAPEFTVFIDHVKKNCFWESISGLPAADAVWYPNPVYFLDQLHRCMVPFHHEEGPVQHRYYKRCLNEALELLKKRKRELGSTPLAASTAARFLKWFGYSVTATSASPITPVTGFSAYSHGAVYPIPHVSTLAAAISKVTGVIDKLISALESEIKTSNVMRAFSVGDYENTYAYVYGIDTANKHIHLAKAFLGIAGSGMPRLNNRSPLDWDSDINTFVHEATHFNDLGMLRDCSISNSSGSVSFGPYGARNCLGIATNFPSCALMNSDNFSFYIEDGMHGTSDSFSYLF